jgi:hypothetical protein
MWVFSSFIFYLEEVNHMLLQSALESLEPPVRFQAPRSYLFGLICELSLSSVRISSISSMRWGTR